MLINFETFQTKNQNSFHPESDHDDRILKSQKSLKSISTSLSKLEAYFQEKLEESKKMTANKLNSDIEKNNKKIKSMLDERVRHCCEVVEENC